MKINPISSWICIVSFLLMALAFIASITVRKFNVLALLGVVVVGLILALAPAGDIFDGLDPKAVIFGFIFLFAWVGESLNKVTV